MKRDNLPWRAASPALIEWDDANTPSSPDFGDIYYSPDNGIEESLYTFLAGNALPKRWGQHRPNRFTIGETGFGTGLNFLLTWQAWRAVPDPKPPLHYLSVERFPLRREDLGRALESWPELAALSQSLLAAYPGLAPGEHRLVFDAGRVVLDLWWADATEALGDLASRGSPYVDAWYLDGFAPSGNPDMWTRDLCNHIAQLSRPGASFATFTAAGQVRRDLHDAGFDVEKAPGYGRKRERLTGRLTARPTASGADSNIICKPTETPWDLRVRTGDRPESALVIGAGLAGCTVANALAQRGIAVTVLDKNTCASGASGNDQGLLFTRLSRKHSTLTDFALQSFHYATRFYANMFKTGALEEGLDGSLCGNLLMHDNTTDLAYLEPELAGIREFAEVLTQDEAALKTGQALAHGGFWLPQSGWLNPPAVCNALLSHPAIRLVEQCGELTIEYHNGIWHAQNLDERLASADCAVVTAGPDCDSFEQLNWLSLQKIRGQISTLPQQSVPGVLQSAICGEGYIAPARQGSHCVGATFKLRFDTLEPLPDEHRENIERLGQMLPEWKNPLGEVDTRQLHGRVGVRCASPDYLPLVGPVPDRDSFLGDYADLRKNARAVIAKQGTYLPGLYLSTAHGSRGLTSAPLTAELLASDICCEPDPLRRELTRALAPARFIIRDLSRNRI